MKQDSLVGVVQRWEAHGVEVMVWDRAPSHRAQKVKAVGVKMIEQPAYSPELNPVERVIEQFCCSRGRPSVRRSGAEESRH